MVIKMVTIYWFYLKVLFGSTCRLCFHQIVQRQSRSQSFVPLDQRSENVSSGSNHYERTKEITEFWLSGSLRICIYGACLKWLLPELSFSDRWSRGTKLWERDWYKGNWSQWEYKITISDLYYPCQQNSILSMCCLNKTITTLNQSVFIAVFVTFTF